MIIGGLEKFSLIDYPEHLSAIVFTQGCNFRCHFCYNPMLVVPHTSLSIQGEKDLEMESDKLENTAHEAGREKSFPLITEDSFFLFLNSRIGKLDAVVISGGEPTLRNDLPEFIRKIKALNFKVKLDTNGTNPEMLQKLLEENLLDYIAMDIKAPRNKYDLVVGAQPDLNKIAESIKIIMLSRVLYEFRTTIVPGLHKKEDINLMGEMIRGASKWYLQKFESDTKLVNDNFEGQVSFSDGEFVEMVQRAKQFVNYCDYR